MQGPLCCFILCNPLQYSVHIYTCIFFLLSIRSYFFHVISFTLSEHDEFWTLKREQKTADVEHQSNRFNPDISEVVQLGLTFTVSTHLMFWGERQQIASPRALSCQTDITDNQSALFFLCGGSRGLQLLISDMCQMLLSLTAQRASRDKDCWMLDKTRGKSLPCVFALKWEKSELLKRHKPATA